MPIFLFIGGRKRARGPGGRIPPYATGGVHEGAGHLVNRSA